MHARPHRLERQRITSFFADHGCVSSPPNMMIHMAHFLSLSDIMDLRHQSSAMCIIMLGEKTHTRVLQQK